MFRNHGLLYMFRNHKSNSQLKVDGKMTNNGADKVGLIQAVALLVFALGTAVLMICFGLSLFK